MNRSKLPLAKALMTGAMAAAFATASSASVITAWSNSNVITTDTLDADGNGYSYIYDQNVEPSDPGTAQTSGYIKFTPDESTAPGLEVENEPGDIANTEGQVVDRCIVANSDFSSCNSEFQSGKRFKLDRTAFDPIDLVFDLDTQNLDESPLYKVFQKYGNNIGSPISGFTIQTGFGIGTDFVASTSGDGLGFFNFGNDPAANQFSSLFAAGLFGPTSDRHPIDGYFSKSRAGFGLEMVSEDLFKSTVMFGDYSNLFGDWMSYSMTPDGYFYDHDGDPTTDAILMAHKDENSGEWIMNRELTTDGTVVTMYDGNNGTRYSSVADVESALKEQAENPNLELCSDISTGACLAGVGQIEDLAKFNVTYSLSLDTVLTASLSDLFPDTQGAPDSFTLRVTAQPSLVPETGGLSLMALSLIGMWVRRSRKKATA